MLQFVQASGCEVQIAERQEALRVQLGEQLYIDQDGEGELVLIEKASPGVLKLRNELNRHYFNATPSRPGLLRFGKPRTWLRVRLQEDG